MCRPTLLEQRNNNGYTILWIACAKGLKDTAKFLLPRGANVEAATPDGVRPLWIACRFQQAAIVRLLLADTVRAAVNAPCNDGSTPLHIACYRRWKAGAQFLETRGASIQQAKNALGVLPVKERLAALLIYAKKRTSSSRSVRS